MKRYEYYAPGPWKSMGIALMDLITGDTTPKEWVINRQTGERFALDDAESSVLQALGDSLSYVGALPKEQSRLIIDRSFDAFVEACVAKRAGDIEQFRKFSSWSTKEWREWLQALAYELAHDESHL